MTTLYRPVKIETAEQAEALPDDALVINGYGDRYNRTPWGQWHSAADDRDLSEDLDSVYFPVAITALVPIKVEVEHIRESGGHRREKTLYITPWATPAPAESGDDGEALAESGDV